MASDNCDLVWRCVCSASRSRVLRHKGQKSFRAVANTESQTPEEEIDTYSSAREFAKTKESFADAISDAEKQIKTQESVSHSNTKRIAVGNRDSIGQAGRNTGIRSGKEGMAERLSFTGSNRRL
jgi:hypothetical protein